jgi:hypothetical protein
MASSAFSFTTFVLVEQTDVIELAMLARCVVNMKRVVVVT